MFVFIWILSTFIMIAVSSVLAVAFAITTGLTKSIQKLNPPQQKTPKLVSNQTIATLLAPILGIVLFFPISTMAEEDDEHHEHSRTRIESKTKTNSQVLSNAVYKAECSSCHMAYPPGLLPSKSWNSIINNLKNHFGVDASVDQAVADQLKTFLTKNSADGSTVAPSTKISRGITHSDASLRITETAFFKREHREISKSVWSRKSIMSPSNCVSCHARAETGHFSEEEVKIPR